MTNTVNKGEFLDICRDGMVGALNEVKADREQFEKCFDSVAGMINADDTTSPQVWVVVLGAMAQNIISFYGKDQTW